MVAFADSRFHSPFHPYATDQDIEVGNKVSQPTTRSLTEQPIDQFLDVIC